MYIRTETIIPIASILIGKGVAHGTMIALIIGGAGASIPEVLLLGSIFKKKMVIAFLGTITGYGVMSIPALVINEKVVSSGKRTEVWRNC